MRQARPAVLGGLRRRGAFDLGGRSSGPEDARGRWGRRAKESLCHHHSRTGVNRALIALADDGSCDRRLAREGPAKRRAASRHSAVIAIAGDELCRGIQGTKDREVLQRLSHHQDEYIGRLTDLGNVITQVAMIGGLHRGRAALFGLGRFGRAFRRVARYRAILGGGQVRSGRQDHWVDHEPLGAAQTPIALSLVD